MVDGIDWQAKNITPTTIKANTEVEIVSFEGTILNVKVLEECKK